MTDPHSPIILIGIIYNIVWLFDGDILGLGKATELNQCSFCRESGHYARTCKKRKAA